MFTKGKDLKKELTSHGKNIPLLKKVFLAKGVVPRIMQVAESEFSEVCSMKDNCHSHPTMWELYYVLEGEAKYFVGDEIYKVMPGDFVAVAPNTPHYQEITKAPHRILYWGIAVED
ncbi:MAG: cupin domain-containing protein [Patescibacteria group bacterium]